MDENSTYEILPDAYERELTVFDEDQNGQAIIEDMMRALKSHAQMPDEDIAKFIKINALGSKAAAAKDEVPLD